MKKIKANHVLQECARCSWNNGRGSKACEVYKDKRNVMLDDRGNCYSRLYSDAKRNKIKQECRKYEDVFKGK